MGAGREGHQERGVHLPPGKGLPGAGEPWTWPLLVPVLFEVPAPKEPSPQGPQGEVTSGRLS